MVEFGSAGVVISKKEFEFSDVVIDFKPLRVICTYPPDCDFKIKPGVYTIIVDNTFKFENYKSRNYKGKVIFKKEE